VRGERDVVKVDGRGLFGGLFVGGIAVLGLLLRVRGQHAHLAGASSARAAIQVASTPLPEIPAGQPRLSFFALGDTGWQNEAKASVVRAMSVRARDARPDFVLLLGDNFYPEGVRAVDDPAWKTHFEQAFAADELQVPFYAALGNHDHGGNAEAEVEYGLEGGRWRMPASYFAFTRSLSPSCDVAFFVLDTTPLRLGDHSADEQIRWFEDKLARSTARWKIVVGHHPVESSGNHGGSSSLQRLVEPLFVRYGVDLYVSGHDHDLELLKTDVGYLQLVSGAGSTTRDVGWQDETLYAEAEPGFAWLLLLEHDLWIQLVTARDGARFTHHVSKRGEVRG
jgi:acid phosphatase